MNKDIWKKKFPAVLAAALALLAVGCWPALFYRWAQSEKQYAALVQKAETLASKGIYTDAIDCLLQAENKKPGQYDNLLLLADCYEKNGDSACLGACDRAIRANPERVDAYLIKADYSIGKQDYAGAYATLEDAEKNGCSSAILQERKETLDNLFLRQYVGADSIGEWHLCGSRAYAVFSLGGTYGILRSDGNVSLDAAYSFLGMYDPKTGTLPCRHEGTLCYITTAGNRKMVPDMTADALFAFGEGLAPCQTGGKWGYLDTSMTLRLGELDMAGAFCGGVAAVQKNGKWALMDGKLNNLTAFTLEEIQLDSYGYCCAYERCVVRKDGRWYLTDTEGKILSPGCDGIRFPASENGDIAFCADGLWGFMDRDGNVTLSPAFADAASFSLGLAPVKTEAGWMYIRPDGSQAGAEMYDEAGTFSPDGRAAVKKGSALYLIVMSRYYER